jgi:hypothetical protein
MTWLGSLCTRVSGLGLCFSACLCLFFVHCVVINKYCLILTTSKFTSCLYLNISSILLTVQCLSQETPLLAANCLSAFVTLHWVKQWRTVMNGLCSRRTSYTWSTERSHICKVPWQEWNLILCDDDDDGDDKINNSNISSLQFWELLTTANNLLEGELHVYKFETG